METCIICQKPVKIAISNDESWGATAIENTMPIEMEYWHFDCRYTKVVEDEE